MPLVSVPAIYDGEHIRLLETAPVDGPYRVLVTFVEPTHGEVAPASALDRFWDSFGAWQDDRPVDDTLRDIYATRRSKSDPPAL